MFSVPKVIASDRLEPGELDSVATIHEHACGLATSGFKKFGFAPFLWLFRYRPDDKGPWTLNIMETPWRDEREKMHHVRFMRTLFEELRITHYSFISEVWMAVVLGADALAADDFRPVCERPEREDMLMVTTFDREKNHLLSRWPVFYPKAKRHITTPSGTFGVLQRRADVDTTKAGHFTGRIFNLLEPEVSIRTAKAEAEQKIRDIMKNHQRRGPMN